MAFEKIAEDTFMLRTDSRTCGTVYMIAVGEKRLLIDSGDGKLPDFGFTPGICLLTHGHYDHTGGVKEDWPKALLHPAEFSFKGPYIQIPPRAMPNPMARFRFCGHLLEFFHTPGHTDGSICILDKRTGCLFSGDTKFADSGCGRVDLGGDWDEMEKSLAMIAEINYRLLCPGHGNTEKRLKK